MLHNTLKISLLAAAVVGMGLAHAEATAPQTYADQVKAMQEQFEVQKQQAEKFHAEQLAQIQAIQAQQLAALKANPYTAPIAAMQEQMQKDFAARQAEATQRQAEFAKAHQARVETLRKPASLTVPQFDAKAQEAKHAEAIKAIEAKRAEFQKQAEARRAEMQKQIEAQRAEMQKQIEAQRNLFEEQAKLAPTPVAAI